MLLRKPLSCALLAFSRSICKFVDNSRVRKRLQNELYGMQVSVSRRWAEPAAGS